jgi:hypothetical protein
MTNMTMCTTINKRYRGQIVQWDAIRLFGFVQAGEVLPFGSDRLFIHKLNCIDVPFLGAWVEFEIGDPYRLKQNPQAVRVRVVEEEPVNAEAQIGAQSKVGA